MLHAEYTYYLQKSNVLRNQEKKTYAKVHLAVNTQILLLNIIFGQI